MIKRKAIGKKHKFWQHYHRVIDLCYEGNVELLERINRDTGEEIKRLYLMANIPKKYFDFEFSKIKNSIATKNSVAISVIEKYLNSLPKAAKKGIGLFLTGPHGVSKTTIATIILKAATQQFFRCFFWKSTEIVEFIKSGWKNEYRRVFFEYIINTVDFLVIDDVARLFDSDNESFSKTEQVFIDKIFSKRDDLNLSTILTSNYGLQQSKELFGEAAFSSFVERLIEVKLTGTDFHNVIGENLVEEL